MKKSLAILLLSFSLLKLSSQPLTNFTAFDFNVGDVILKKTTYNGLFYILDSIKGKTFSPANDTVFYNIKTTSYSFTGPPPGQTATNTAVYTYSFTNLGNTVSPLLYQNQTDTLKSDSSYVSYCGLKVYGYKYKCLTPCPYLSIYEVRNFVWYIEGLGGPYQDKYYTNAGNSPGSFYSDVIYYKKGAATCGTLSIPTSLNEETLFKDFSVFPNPASGEIQIKLPEQAGRATGFVLSDATGRVVLRINNPSSKLIDVSGLNSGLYFLQVSTVYGNISRKIIIVK